MLLIIYWKRLVCFHVYTYPVWLGRLAHLMRRPSHTDRHFVSTASCVKTTLALPTKELGCHEIETNISSAYENTMHEENWVTSGFCVTIKVRYMYSYDSWLCIANIRWHWYIMSRAIMSHSCNIIYMANYQWCPWWIISLQIRKIYTSHPYQIYYLQTNHLYCCFTSYKWVRILYII